MGCVMLSTRRIVEPLSARPLTDARPAAVGPVLDVRGLSVSFTTPEGRVAAVSDLSFVLNAGQTLGVVGESGSGKSQTFMAIMGLLAANGRATGSVAYRGQEILGLAPSALNRLRGQKIAMIFQDPMTSLNPFLTVRRQLTEVLTYHQGASETDAGILAEQMLDRVRIPDARRRLDMYPHEFSGGMRQRVMIAMALMCHPDVLIADEPTTALDVTVQAQILDLMRELRRDFATAIIMITHDMGVIAGLADHVMVMYGGRAVEAGPVRDIFYDPRHPYTAGLLRSMPSFDSSAGTELITIPGQPPNLQRLPVGCCFAPRCVEALAICRVERPQLLAVSEDRTRACHLPLGGGGDQEIAAINGRLPGHDAANPAARVADAQPLLSVCKLDVTFRIGRGFLRGADWLKAVDGLSFDLWPGQTLGVVGESGCGKTTLGRAILRLTKPTAGRVLWLGSDLSTRDTNELRANRREMTVIFQDPLASLDPRMTVGDIIGEPLIAHDRNLSAADRRARVRKIMGKVGLAPEMINRYPHEFSGGQAQRIGIARAMILKPKLIICDEPVSALDVSIQAQIVNLLIKIQKESGLSLIFISHDLSVVRHIADRIMILYLGRLMEIANRDAICSNPRHPYTQALISAVPIPDPDRERAKQRIVLRGDIPSPLSPPSGCVFRTRCPQAVALCAESTPVATTVAPHNDPGHLAACHFSR